MPNKTIVFLNKIIILVFKRATQPINFKTLWWLTNKCFNLVLVKQNLLSRVVQIKISNLQGLSSLFSKVIVLSRIQTILKTQISNNLSHRLVKIKTISKVWLEIISNKTKYKVETPIVINLSWISRILALIWATSTKIRTYLTSPKRANQNLVILLDRQTIK